MSTEVVTLGEVLVALVADEGRPLAAAGTFTPFVAGAEANVAMGLARLGRNVAFIGRVGDDGLGRMLRTGLRGEGVDVRWLSDDPEAPTGALARDRRSFPPCEVVYLRRGSAASRLDPDDVGAAGEAIAGARWLHLTGDHAGALGEYHAAVEPRARVGARRQRARVARRQPAAAPVERAERQAPVLRDLAERCDLVIAGEDEATLLCGSPEAGRDLAERFGAEAVVKLGARGAVGCRGDELAQDARHRGRGGRRGRCRRRVQGRVPRRAARRSRPWPRALRGANACGAVAVAAVGDAHRPAHARRAGARAGRRRRRRALASAAVKVS